MTPGQVEAAPSTHLLSLGVAGISDARALEIALESMPVGISWARLEDQKIIFTNRKFTELFGYTAEDLSTIEAWIHAYPHPEDRELAEQNWGAYFLSPNRHEHAVDPFEVRIRCKDGTMKVAVNSGVILPDTGWALATFVDITELKANLIQLKVAQRAAQENETIYRTLLHNSPEMMVVRPLDGSRPYVSPAVERLTGFNAGEYLALHDLDFIHPDDRDLAHGVFERMRSGEMSHVQRYRALQRDGGYRCVEATLTGYLGPETGEFAGYVATIRDDTERKQREERLTQEHLRLSEAAFHDELTGLLNRRGFNSLMLRESQRQSCSPEDLALLLVDVDCFKQFNDTYGHLAGDECLKRIATALRSCLRLEVDLVARYGGEEFIVLFSGMSAEGVCQGAGRMVNVVYDLNIEHRGSPDGVVSISIGAATLRPGAPFNVQELIAAADTALYQAKEAGRNCASCNGSFAGPRGGSRSGVAA